MEASGVSPSQRRYSPEFKQRAVRMVRQLRAETGEKHGTLQRVATQLGCGVESLRLWVNQDLIDQGEHAGTSTEDGQRLKELEQENRELRRANAILRSASAFFAAELDRPQK
jgi:transposase